MTAAPIVLITRPQPDADAFAQAVELLGAQPVVAPLLVVRAQPMAVLPDARWQAVLLTSRHAAPALQVLGIDTEIPVFTVGDATREAVRLVAGGRETVDSRATARALLQGVRTDCYPEGGPILYLRGREISTDIAGILREEGFSVEERVTYAAETTGIPQALRDVLAQEQKVLAPFFSARTAEVFRDIIRQLDKKEALRQWQALCISPAVAEALDSLPFASVTVARSPDQAGILRLVEAHLTDYIRTDSVSVQ